MSSMSEGVSSEVVHYYFFRPVVREATCSLGKVHRVTVDTTYHTRMADGSEREITRGEYERRPR